MKITRRQLRKIIQEQARRATASPEDQRLVQRWIKKYNPENIPPTLTYDSAGDRDNHVLLYVKMANREGKKMKITRRQLRQIINEERMLFENEEHESELREFSRGRGGNNVRKSGAKIASAATQIGAEAEIQTGKMRETLYNIADFIGKVGSALSGLGSLDEGDGLSMADSLPTVQELRRLQKEIARLEK